MGDSGLPLYFFHTAAASQSNDLEGTELPNFAAARREAIRYAGEVMRDDPDVLLALQGLRVQVADEGGTVLMTLVALATELTDGSEVRCQPSLGQPSLGQPFLAR